jgi:hypothetical protein
VVSELVNDEQSAGWKDMQWNATRFASGIYFYELGAGDFVQSRKMILITDVTQKAGNIATKSPGH